jgi:Na+/H+ antiporter NhaA
MNDSKSPNLRPTAEDDASSADLHAAGPPGVVASSLRIRFSTLVSLVLTLLLFIAGAAFPNSTAYAASKIAIFLASIIAGTLGVMILWPKPKSESH